MSANLYCPLDIKCSQSLVHLSLKNVKPFDGVIDHLLSKCQRLLTLELEIFVRDPNNEYKPDPKYERSEFCVSLPELQSAGIWLSCNVLKIDTPNLQALKVCGSLVGKIEIENAPQLKKLVFNSYCDGYGQFEDANYIGDIVHNVANIRFLSLSERQLKKYTKHFKNGRRAALINLKEFRLEHADWWMRYTYWDVVCFFQDCPSLEKFYISFADTCHASGGWGKLEWENDVQEEDASLTSKFGEEKFLDRLRIIKMMDVSHDRLQFGLIKFLLKKASVLSVLHIKLDGIFGEKKWSIEDKQESMFKFIHTWPRASHNAIMDVIRYVPPRALI